MEENKELDFIFVTEDEYFECVRQLENRDIKDVYTVLDDYTMPHTFTTFYKREVAGHFTVPDGISILEEEGEDFPIGTEFYLREDLYEEAKINYH